MAKFVPDIKTQRWIVITPIRWDRPGEHRDKEIKEPCPFCFGNEKLTPPEVTRVG